MKLISGVLSPNGGTVEVNGKISALLELGSGFNPEFTGIQNIFFYGTILGFTRKEMQERLDDILEFADIGEFIHQPLKTYSSGMRARLGFSVAVNIDPDILILDEVLSVGDILFRRKCYSKMKEFFDGGKTIIYVSHSSGTVKELCSRAIFLLDGDIVLDADPKTVTHYYEKYQFLSKEAQRDLKKEMLAYRSDEEKYNLESVVEGEVSKEEENDKSEKFALLDGDEYLPTFQSKPTFGESKLATFDQYTIVNNNNMQVNVLQVGHIYTLKFRVHFNQSAEDIYFGAEFLTIKGNLLSGVDTKRYKTNSIYSIKSGESYEVKISFKCNLLPEIYVVNIYANNEEGGLTIHDACIFKVKSVGWFEAGMVYLDQEIAVEKLEK